MRNRSSQPQRLPIPADLENLREAEASPQEPGPWPGHGEEDATPVAPMRVAVRLVRCRACGGRGVVHVLDPEGPFQHALTCPICDGAGRFPAR